MHSKEQYYSLALFLIDHNMVVELWLCKANNRRMQTNPPTLQAISIAMLIRRYNAEHIAQYSRSRATLDTVEHCHWASICPLLPRRMPWSTNLAVKQQVVVCEIAFSKLAFKRHKTNLRLSTSKQQAA
jgi:hypothetical protein